MAEDNKILNRLKRFFKVNYSKKGDTFDQKFSALKKVSDIELAKSSKLDKEPWSNETKELFNYWMNNCHDSAESWKNRTELYTDMENLYYNCSMIARAVELMADEVIQADSNQQPIFVEAKRATKNKIMEFFDKTNIYELLRPTAVDIIQFGNAGWMPVLGESGVEEIIPISVREIRDRLEFTPYEVQQKIKKSDTLFTQLRGIERLDQLIDIVANKEKIASKFKTYLFGFQIGDFIVPPWRFLHFRNLTNKSPFKPFGIPVFIHAMSAYRQYDASLTFQVVARGLKYPKDKYEVNIPNVIDPTDKLMMGIEFLNELMNSGFGTTEKEVAGLNDVIITIKDLFDYSQISPDIDLGKIDDIQMLRDDLMNATFLPRNLIDPNDSGFGDSGVSLIQKWKPFARQIYRIQNILLQNITQLVKIHMLHSPDFSEKDMDFILSMPYPESQIDRDLISNQKDLLDLANDIIDTLQDRITGGEALPPEMIQQIYHQFLPYDDQRIDRWIGDAKKSIPKDDGEGADNTDFESEEKPFYSNYNNNSNKIIEDAIDSRKVWQEIEEKVGKQNLQEHVSNIILEEKQKVMREGSLQGRHYYSSKNQYVEFPAEMIRSLDKKRISKLAESSDVSEYYKEEVKYEFKTYSEEDKENKKDEQEKSPKEGEKKKYKIEYDKKDCEVK